jgi:hypothetical protein
MNMLEGCRNRTLAAGLAWMNAPEEWEAGPDGLRVALRVKCDFFRPHGGEARDDAHLLHARLRGDFALTARIAATLANTFDAGGLMVRGAEDQWVKLCIERGVRGETKVVSVVTRRWSDDADHFLLPGAGAWLRITRKGAQFGLHWSEDGRLWRFVRAFPLELPAEVMAGALAQAPRAPGGSVLFTSLAWLTSTAADFRSGE